MQTTTPDGYRMYLDFENFINYRKTNGYYWCEEKDQKIISIVLQIILGTYSLDTFVKKIYGFQNVTEYKE